MDPTCSKNAMEGKWFFDNRFFQKCVMETPRYFIIIILNGLSLDTPRRMNDKIVVGHLLISPGIYRFMSSHAIATSIMLDQRAVSFIVADPFGRWIEDFVVLVVQIAFFKKDFHIEYLKITLGIRFGSKWISKV